MEILFLVFWGTSTQFSTVAAPTYIPTNFKRVPFSPHHLQHLLFVYFLTKTIWPVWGGYFIVVLICVSLIIKDVEHPFMCLLTISVSFGEIFIKVLWPFFSCVVCLLLLSYMSCLENKLLSVASFANIFSHFLGCLFIFSMVFFAFYFLSSTDIYWWCLTKV